MAELGLFSAKLLFWAACCFSFSGGSPVEVNYYSRFASEHAVDGWNSTSVSSMILSVIADGQHRKMDEMMANGNGTSNRELDRSCHLVHRLFRKYKREFNSDQSMADEPHAITSTAYIKVNGPKRGRIPLAVKADVTEDMVACHQSKLEKTYFTLRLEEDLTKQMEIMESRNSDRRGHLISSKLCGPERWYNVAPLAISNVDSKWPQAQDALKSWIAREGGRLEIVALLIYEEMKTTWKIRELSVGSRRPTGLATCYRLFDRYNRLLSERSTNVDNELAPPQDEN